MQWDHSAILLTFIKLPFVVKTFVLSIFKWPFYTGFTVHEKYSTSKKAIKCYWTNYKGTRIYDMVHRKSEGYKVLLAAKVLHISKQYCLENVFQQILECC